MSYQPKRMSHGSEATRDYRPDLVAHSFPDFDHDFTSAETLVSGVRTPPCNPLKKSVYSINYGGLAPSDSLWSKCCSLFSRLNFDT